MTRSLQSRSVRSPRYVDRRGYITLLVFVILVFFATIAGMHMLMCIGVGQTARAYDAYRQGFAEATRLERAVNESCLMLRGMNYASSNRTTAEEVAAQLAALDAGGTAITVNSVPATLPAPVSFPDVTAAPDPLGAPSAALQCMAPAALSQLLGPRVAEYPVQEFRFTSRRTVLDQAYDYSWLVQAQLVAVPMTRYSVVAYELPSEIGAATAGAGGSAPVPTAPPGLAPGSDPASLPDLQAAAGTMPYYFRRRAILAAAYQYLYSQCYLDRVAEYVGITHYHDLDAAANATAQLDGLARAGNGANFDLGLAGGGQYATIRYTKDAVVVFTRQAGKTVTLSDSVGNGSAAPMLVVLAGPPPPAAPLAVNFAGSIQRPVVLVGYNIRVTAAPNVGLAGALFLDPMSSVAVGTGPLHVAHLSYSLRAGGVPAGTVQAGAPLPHSAEILAPRVIYVATTQQRI